MLLVMTTSHAFPVLGCPACNAPLSGAASCPACGLRLVGPDAQLLWELDRRLAPLLVERDLLLGRLRGAAGPYGTTGPAGATVSGALGRTRPAGPGDPRGPARSAKDLLLGAGGLLLAFAALVFAAWSYGRLGPAARCGALVAAAGASVAASWVAARRGLRSTAECAAGVALVLAAVALQPARAAGLLGSDLLRSESWFAVGTAGLAVLAVAFAAVVPTTAARIAAVLLAHAPVVFLLARDARQAGAVAVVLAALAVVDAAAALAAQTIRGDAAATRPVRRALLVTATAAARAWHWSRPCPPMCMARGADRPSRTHCSPWRPCSSAIRRG